MISSDHNIVYLSPGGTEADQQAKAGYDLGSLGMPSLQVLSDGDSPDAIVLCSEGLDEGGIEQWIGRIRSQDLHTPVIVVTEALDSRGIRSAFRAGADDAFERPPLKASLVAMIRESVASAKRRRAGDSHGFDAVGTVSPMRHDRRSFMKHLSGLRSLCRRQSKPICVVVFDIDNFAHCNERYSTAFGDELLTWFGRTLESVRRCGDLCAYYGGDQFVVAIPDANAAAGQELVDRCNRQMRKTSATRGHANLEVTVCAGIVGSTIGVLETEQQLLKRALMALEFAKQTGVNQTATWSGMLKTTASLRNVDQLGVDGMSRWVRRLREELRSAHLESTRALVAAAEAKDPFVLTHSMKVSNYAETICRRLDLPMRHVKSIRTAAFLHDVGKIGVPDAILIKPGRLNKVEYDIVKRHPSTGADILGHVSSLGTELPMILHHHERFDGGGYPAGLGEKEIPLGARIIAVADAIDVMFSKRSYKKPYCMETVRTELIACSGKQFDPELVAVALDWLTETPEEYFLLPGAKSISRT